MRRIEPAVTPGSLLAAAVVHPKLVGGQHEIALHRVDIAGEGRDLLVLHDLEAVRGDLDRQLAVVLEALRPGGRPRPGDREGSRRGGERQDASVRHAPRGRGGCRQTGQVTRTFPLGRAVVASAGCGLSRPAGGRTVTLTRPSKRSTSPASWISKRSAESVPAGPSPSIGCQPRTTALRQVDAGARRHEAIAAAGDHLDAAIQHELLGIAIVGAGLAP